MWSMKVVCQLEVDSVSGESENLEDAGLGISETWHSCTQGTPVTRVMVTGMFPITYPFCLCASIGSYWVFLVLSTWKWDMLVYLNQWSRLRVQNERNWLPCSRTFVASGAWGILMQYFLWTPIRFLENGLDMDHDSSLQAFQRR